MKSPKKANQDLLSGELAEATDKAIGKVELVIEDQRSARIFFLRATRKECYIRFTWSKALVAITAVAGIILGIIKYCP
jgi:hypothetical protein